MSTDITISNDGAFKGMTVKNGTFTTITGDDFDSQVKVFNAVNDAESVSDIIGKPIKVVDIIAEETEFVDDKTGEVDNAIRTIFLTEDGHAYQVFSLSVWRSVKRLLTLLGAPSTWERPLAVKITEAGPKTARYYRLTLV